MVAERNFNGLVIDYKDVQINARQESVRTSVYHKVEAFQVEVICKNSPRHRCFMLCVAFYTFKVEYLTDNIKRRIVVFKHLQVETSESSAACLRGVIISGLAW